jgi:hypothetical protein
MRQRVICIESFLTNMSTNRFQRSPLTTGENYHITAIERVGSKIFFVLDEKGADVSFNSEAFLICSELDETLLINHPIKRRK